VDSQVDTVTKEESPILSPEAPSTPEKINKAPMKKTVVKRVVKKKESPKTSPNTTFTTTKTIETYPKLSWLKSTKDMSPVELNQWETTNLIRREVVGTSSYRDKQLDVMRKDVLERKQQGTL
jgi:hypothetical protein